MYRVKSKQLSCLRRFAVVSTVAAAASVGLIGCSNNQPKTTSTTAAPTSTAVSTTSTTLPTSTTTKPFGPQPQYHAQLTIPSEAGTAVANVYGNDVPISSRPHGVSCEYKVPAVDTRDNRSVSGEWAGIGGLTGTTLFTSNEQLIQIGTASIGSAFHSKGISAWYETVNPNDPSASRSITIKHFRIKADDTVIASVRYLKGTTWQVKIENLSRKGNSGKGHETYTKKLRFAYFGESAECMVEKPQSNSVTNLADFGTVDFTNLHVIYNGKRVPFSSSLLIATLSMQNTLTSGLVNNSFSVSYAGPIITETTTPLQSLSVGQTAYAGQYGFVLEEIAQGANGKLGAVFEVLYDGHGLRPTPPIQAGDSTTATLSDGDTINMAVKSINAQQQSVAAVFTIEKRS